MGRKRHGRRQRPNADPTATADGDAASFSFGCFWTRMVLGVLFAAQLCDLKRSNVRYAKTFAMLKNSNTIARKNFGAWTRAQCG